MSQLIFALDVLVDAMRAYSLHRPAALHAFFTFYHPSFVSLRSLRKSCRPPPTTHQQGGQLHYALNLASPSVVAFFGGAGFASAGSSGSSLSVVRALRFR
jgi:hypothetical protein